MDFEDWQQHNFFSYFLLVSLIREFKAFLFSLEPFLQPDQTHKTYTAALTLPPASHRARTCQIYVAMVTFEICPGYHWHGGPLCLCPCSSPGLPKVYPNPAAPQGPAKAAVLSLWASLLSFTQAAKTSDSGKEFLALNDVPLASQTCGKERSIKSSFMSLPRPPKYINDTRCCNALGLQRWHAVVLALPLPQARFLPFSSSCGGRAIVIPSTRMLSCVSQLEERPQHVLSCTDQLCLRRRPKSEKGQQKA